VGRWWLMWARSEKIAGPGGHHDSEARSDQLRGRAVTLER